MPGALPLLQTSRDVYTVTRLNREARTILEEGFPPLWVEGEVSNLARPASGHLYFSLKDAHCQVRCALFRSRKTGFCVDLVNGMQVLARAQVGLYEGRGLPSSGVGTRKAIIDAGGRYWYMGSHNGRL